MDKRAVRLAYQLILGREPESEEAVSEWAKYVKTFSELRDCFMRSPEFQAQLSRLNRDSYGDVFNWSSSSPTSAVECDVPPEVLATMFERIRQEWEKLGQEEPFWSVWTDPSFKKEHFNENQKRFYESGRAIANGIDQVLSRSARKPVRGLCLELGCGVGRVTRYLAEKFERVLAVDISPGNLKLCDSYLASQKVTNVETRLIRSPQEFESLPNFDFLFTVIVLQHNPPPVQLYLLDTLLGKISPNGFALFQIPTHIPNYSFSAAGYLKDLVPTMEMHSLPMHRIFGLFAKHDFMPLEVLMDGSTGSYGSHTFFAQKQ